MEELKDYDGTAKALPVIRQKPKMDKKPDRESLVSSHIKKRRKRILVVDDEKNIQDVLTGILSIIGYEVVSAGSGHEGLNLFLKNSIELVLTDLNMPGIDGWTLASHIKRKSPNTPVVLITGSEKGAVDEELKRSCVDSVIFKPFALEDLRKTVQGMVDHKALD
jgi:two-component system NtrC family response regulator